MNIEHMRCFLAVEQSMSFTVAADTLCISQSSLSKQIKALEGELNARLFDRGKKGIKLTPEGKKFSFYAGKMLGEYNDMLAALNDFPPKEKNLIRIACIQTMEQYGIGKMITAFQTENPGTEVSICEMDMVSVLRIFESSAADLAIMRGFSVPPGLYKAYPMLYDEMVFICSAGHRLACRESMNLSEASDDDFIFLSASCGLYDICLNECIKAGFIPHSANSSIKISSIMSYISEGRGVSLLMRKTVEPYITGGNIRVIRLDHKLVDALSIVANESRRPLTRMCARFIDFAMEYFSNAIQPV